MKKINRLTNGDQIYGVIKKNKKIITNVVTVFYRSTNSVEYKIAIIVSKKNFKKAVIRNKVKRQVRAIINDLKLKLNNLNIVIIVKNNWLHNDYKTNKKSLSYVFIKIGGKNSGQ